MEGILYYVLRTAYFVVRIASIPYVTRTTQYGLQRTVPLNKTGSIVLPFLTCSWHR